MTLAIDPNAPRIASTTVAWSLSGGGSPTSDRYGGPVLCQWMIDLGYYDMR